MKNFYILKEKFGKILDIFIDNPEVPNSGYYTEKEELILDELRKVLTEMLIEDHLLPEKGDSIWVYVNNEPYNCELTRNISVVKYSDDKTYSIFNIYFGVYDG